MPAEVTVNFNLLDVGGAVADSQANLAHCGGLRCSDDRGAALAEQLIGGWRARPAVEEPDRAADGAGVEGS